MDGPRYAYPHGLKLDKDLGANGIESAKDMAEDRMMTTNAPITLSLSKDDFIHIFKACEDRREKLDHLQRTSANEEVIADSGNGLVEINMIIKVLKSKADEAWGENGWMTCDECL